MGCSDWGSSADPANHYLRLAGRILNGDTLQPLSGVTVKICNYEVSGTTDGDGHWFIELAPGIVGTYVIVTAERSGFASLGVRVGIFPNTDVFDGSLQEKEFIDLGTAVMLPGQPVTAHVTRDGVPLAGASLFAVPEDLADGPSVFAVDGTGEECSDLMILGVTNASGVATMNNFDPTQHYLFIVPMQDLDGDGLPDIFTAASYLQIIDDGDIITIDTETLTPDTSPEVTGTNLMRFRSSFYMPTGTVANDQSRSFGNPGYADLNNRSLVGDEDVSFSEGVVTANGSVQVVFWNPVQVTEANFRYLNNLVSFAGPDWNHDLRIPATTTTLAGSDSTIINFTPTSPLPSNEVVTLNFIARSLVDPTSSSNIAIDFYVPLHLPTIPVAVDNYNGSMDGSGGSNITYLRFAEAVEGFYKVLEFSTDDTTFTFENPSEVQFQWDGDDQIINNQAAAPATGSNIGQSGALAGKAYTTRIRTPFFNTLSLNDNTVTDVNTITIEISVRNIVGVVLDDVLTLPVE